MKEFFKKHWIAILSTGGIFMLLYIFYEYEQANAANNANIAATTTAPVDVGGTPLTYGQSATGVSNSDTAQTAAGLNDYLNTPTGTSSVVPNTSGSGLATSSVTSTTANGNTTINTPSPAAITAAGAAPYNTETVTPAQAQQITQLAQSAVASSPCAYALNGVNNTGVPTCGPNGYQFSGTGGLSTIDPDVNGVYPGQPGYAAAVQQQISITKGDDPGDTQDIANYTALLNAYGGITTAPATGESEGSQVPAGSTQTAAPVTGTALPAGSPAVTISGRGSTLPASAVTRVAAPAPGTPATGTGATSTIKTGTTRHNNVLPVVKVPATGVNR